MLPLLSAMGSIVTACFPVKSFAPSTDITPGGSKSGAATQNPCAIFSLQLPHKLTHDRVMTAIGEIENVVSVEEL